MTGFQLFPNKKQSKGGKPAHGRRALGFESLENREMLSVTPLSYSLPQSTDTDYLQADWFEQLVVPVATPTAEGAVANEWIIQINQETLKKLSSVSAAANYLDPYGITVLGGLGATGTLYVRMDTGDATLQSEVLAGLSCIDYYEQNYICANNSVAGIVNDPIAAYQWYLETINILPAWDLVTGSGAVVAVLDSGIQLDHPDLQSNIWTNPGEIAGNRIDDDGNGFIDDVHGWNTFNNSPNVSDTDGHGTSVAGIIGAVGNNGIGTIGIAPGVQLLPINASIGSGYASSVTILAGINYIIQLKTEFGVNIPVINLSFAGVCRSSTLIPAIQAANNAGIIIVAGAGNDAKNNDIYSHNNNQFDNFITVAATDQSDRLCSFSSYGNVSVDLAAPGDNIYTSGLVTDSLTGLRVGNGTSYSAPMVSATVALIASLHPDWTSAMIKEAILATVDTLDSLQGKVATGGRLNVGNAVAYNHTDYATAPVAPSELAVVKLADNTLQFKWKDNSRNEKSFEIQYSLDGGTTWQTAKSNIAANATTTVYAPSQTGNFQFRVRAVNDYGNSAWSAPVSIATDSLPKPATPTGLNAAQTTDAINVTWNAVSGATYRLERSLSSGSGWAEIYSGTNTSFADTTVVPGTAYYYRVASINGQAASDPTAAVLQVAPTPTPEKPGGLTADEVTSTSIHLIWNDSQYATQYYVERRLTTEMNWTRIATTTAATYTDGSLKASTTYSYRIISYNGQTSTVSDALTLMTARVVPAAPMSVTAKATGTTNVAVSWKASPTAIVYRVEYSSDNTSWQSIMFTDATATSGTVTGLAPSTKYYFRVYGINESGDSKASTSVTVTMPAVAPNGPPTNITATAQSDKAVVLNWDAVANATSYIIERSTDQSTWTKVSTVTGGKTTYTNSSLKAGTVYYYRISASSTAATTQPSATVSVQTKLTASSAPTLKIDTTKITAVGVTGITVLNPKTPPSTGTYYYYIQYTSAVDAKRKADWSQAVTEKLTGSTWSVASGLNPNTQYYMRVIAVNQDVAPDATTDWNSFDYVAFGTETKVKTKAVPVATISTSGYALNSSNEFGVKLRIKTPQQADNAKTPVLPAGCTIKYELLIADDKSKVDRTTGMLSGSKSLGDVTFTNGTISGKACADSSVIPFGDLVRLGDLTKIKAFNSNWW